MTFGEQPNPTLTQRLVYALHELHRPEIADWALYGTVTLRGTVLLVERRPLGRAGLSRSVPRGWYEDILTLAAMRVGLPVESSVICVVAE